MQRFDEFKIWIRQWQDKVKGVNRVVVRPEELTPMLKEAESHPEIVRGSISTAELRLNLTNISTGNMRAEDVLVALKARKEKEEVI